MNADLLLDNSAWARLRDAPFSKTESTRSPTPSKNASSPPACHFSSKPATRWAGPRFTGELLEELLALPLLHIDKEVERRAIAAQRQLARTGHHRLPQVDLMVAAVADRQGVGVLHYDADYDVLTTKTDLRFDSVWLAPRGSL